MGDYWAGQVLATPPSPIPTDAFLHKQCRTWNQIVDGDVYHKIGPPTLSHVLRRRGRLQMHGGSVRVGVSLELAPRYLARKISPPLNKASRFSEHHSTPTFVWCWYSYCTPEYSGKS